MATKRMHTENLPKAQTALINGAMRLRSLVKTRTEIAVVKVVHDLLVSGTNIQMQNMQRCQGGDGTICDLNIREVKTLCEIIRQFVVEVGREKTCESETKYNLIFGVDKEHTEVKRYIHESRFELATKNINHLHLTICILRDVIFSYNKLLRRHLKLKISNFLLKWARDLTSFQTSGKFRICEREKDYLKISKFIFTNDKDMESI